MGRDERFARRPGALARPGPSAIAVIAVGGHGDSRRTAMPRDGVCAMPRCGLCVGAAGHDLLKTNVDGGNA